MKVPSRKEILVANCFAVGGMIGLGKSTLVTELARELSAKPIFELDKNDKIQQALLASLYEGKRVQSPDVFQVDFLLTRSLRYKSEIKKNQLVIFDRTIFEDLLFAHQNMAKVPHRYKYYQELWACEVNALVYTHGVPKKYILLDATFEVFEKRLFARNRLVETNNYDQNKEYFQQLHRVYIPYMKSILEEYGISYKIIDAARPKPEVVQQALKFLQENS